MKQDKKKIIVGLTGGIGSGKTTVSKYFKELGIAVYHADVEAKTLMTSSEVIKKKLTALFGENSYKEDQLNKNYLAQKIFNDKNLLQKMNAIIHPKVATHFKHWLKQQTSEYVLKEVAIIFEHNLEDQYNFIITVVTDKSERIKRVIKRDNKTEKEILSVIKNQLGDSEKINKSDFVIYNNNIEDVKNQVLRIHKNLLLIFKSGKF
jgi:dephospho-CoA kinase